MSDERAQPKESPVGDRSDASVSEDVVFVNASWDSGPYGTYYATDKRELVLDAPRGYGDNTAPVARAIWERYDQASHELSEAEDALYNALEAALEAARAKDPRWQKAQREWDAERALREARRDA